MTTSLRFLGKESRNGESPTLYATDQQSYVVQGYLVEPEVRATLDVPPGETCVEVYVALFAHLAKDGVTGTVDLTAAPIVHFSGEDTCIIRGKVVTDVAARKQMRVPAHEDCVEVPKSQMTALMKSEDA